MKSIITVSARNQRISPKKVRLVIDLVREMPAVEAEIQLKHLNKKAAKELADLLHSAIDAAKNKGFKDEDLYICETVCGEGRKLKRHHPNARGRVNSFQKRMSHIRISLAEIDKNKKEEKQKKVSKKKVSGEKNGTES